MLWYDWKFTLVIIYSYDFTALNWPEGLLTEILKQRLHETGAVAIETAVYVDVWTIDCGKDQLGFGKSMKVL